MLKNAIMNQQNTTFTENGALTNESTKSHVLDLFALGGAISQNGNLDAVSLFQDAFYENKILALKTMFYISDIRAGQGRRDFFKNIMKHIAATNPQLAVEIMPYIPFLGRWDYLYWFVGTSVEREAMVVFANEVTSALKEKRTSLVFKWLASEDASSSETKANAALTRKYFGLTPRRYRKMLSQGRKALDIVERRMSAGEWNEINYEAVPSVAMKRYAKAFQKHNVARLEKFIEAVKSGEAKVNSSVLYPADFFSGTIYEEVAKIQWDALPNYIAEGINALAVVDTSDSMWGDPFNIAASLGIYLAERLSGPFKDTVMSFSEKAHLFDISQGDIFDKFNYLERNSIAANTNLQSVFDLILSTAVKYNVPQPEMINRIIILSDMEFDRCAYFAPNESSNSWHHRDKFGRHAYMTNLQVIQSKYKDAGYEMPQIVFWNVDARTKQVAATKDESGVVLVSGYSPVVMKTVLSDRPYITPYGAMLKVINVPRYDFVDEFKAL